MEIDGLNNLKFDYINFHVFENLSYFRNRIDIKI